MTGDDKKLLRHITNASEDTGLSDYHFNSYYYEEKTSSKITLLIDSIITNLDSSLFAPSTLKFLNNLIVCIYFLNYSHFHKNLT